jgi:osmoprotectant transport system permease protein
VIRMELRPSWYKLALLPVVVVLSEFGVYLYLANTPVHSLIQRTIEGDLLSSDAIITALIRHMELVGIAFALCLAIGLPLAVLLFRSGRVLRVVVLALAVLGQAVPSIAVLALASVYIGLGIQPTVLALVVYGLLPLLRNTIVGLEAVDPGAVDAARGMGMSELQVLLRVQVPLASPVIMAGVRTTLVLIVGTATLGNFIGGGGLGDLISEGINAQPSIGPRIVIAGAAIAAGVALLCDWLASLATRVVIPRI